MFGGPVFLAFWWVVRSTRVSKPMLTRCPFQLWCTEGYENQQKEGERKGDTEGKLAHCSQFWLVTLQLAWGRERLKKVCDYKTWQIFTKRSYRLTSCFPEEIIQVRRKKRIVSIPLLFCCGIILSFTRLSKLLGRACLMVLCRSSSCFSPILWCDEDSSHCLGTGLKWVKE